MEQHRNSLQPGYKLHWYNIIKILGQGGFGITYLAEDPNLNLLVAIKEYLPIELAVREDGTSIHPLSGEHGEQYRWGLDRFISEAQTLARFKHPNIVRVLAVFNENNTAYMVMEYEQGKGMHDVLKERKTIAEDELKKILLPILDGLESVHIAGFIHRDIKPPNIYIRNDGSPVLLDFGSARQSLSQQTHTLTTMVSPGYAPFEQYVSKSDKQGPWTDIYGLGATLYRSVTGIAPPDSMDRSEALLHTGKDIFVSTTEIASASYSHEFLTAIDHAMAFKAGERPQSIAAWRKDFNTTLKAEPVRVSDSEAETVALIHPTEVNVTTDTKVAAPGFFSRLIDRLNHIVKKLLKWGLVLFGILLIIGILSDGKKKQEQDNVQPEQTQPEAVEEPPAVVMEEPASQELQIQQLLDEAEKNIAALQLTTPKGNNAVEKYNAVMELDPGNTSAIKGLDNVVQEYINLMDYAVSKNNLPRAETFLSKGTKVNPEYPGLVAARKKLEAARLAAEQKEEIKSVVTDQKTDKPVSLVPEAERRGIKEARDKVLREPDNIRARRDMRKLGERIQKKIKEAINNKQYDLAEDYVNEILQYAPEKSHQKTELEKVLRMIEMKKKEAAGQ